MAGDGGPGCAAPGVVGLPPADCLRRRELATDRHRQTQTLSEWNMVSGREYWRWVLAGVLGASLVSWSGAPTYSQAGGGTGDVKIVPVVPDKVGDLPVLTPDDE